MDIIKLEPTNIPRSTEGKGKYKRRILENADFIKQQIRDNGGTIGIKVVDIRTMLDAPLDYESHLMFNRLVTYLKPLNVRVNGGEIKGERIFIFSFYNAFLEMGIESNKENLSI